MRCCSLIEGDLTEHFTDFVFDGLRPAGALLEACQIRKQFAVDKGFEVVARHGGVVVDLAVGTVTRHFWRGPCGPAVGLAQDELVVTPLQHHLGGFVGFKGVQVLQKQQPTGLLGVVQFAGAPRVFVQDVIDIF